MPKLKTNKAAAKRFRITGTGKVKYSRANKQHILEKKSSKRKGKLRKAGIVSKADMGRVKALLPYAKL